MADEPALREYSEADLAKLEAQAPSHLHQYAFSGRHILRLLLSVRRLQRDLKSVEADRDHWRHNHSEAIRRKRVADEYKEDFRSRAIMAEQRADSLAADLDELETSARSLLTSLGEYVRQSMEFNPEWRDGIQAIQRTLLRLGRTRQAAQEGTKS